MNFILKYAPSFLKEIDRRLRINYPWFWATKFHITLFLSFILAILFSFVGIVYNIDIKDVLSWDDAGGMFALLCIPATIWLIFSFYQLALYNDDKNYGKSFLFKPLIVFLVYFFTFALPLVIPYSAALIVNYRVANLSSDSTLEKAINDYKYGKIYFPTDPYYYSYYESDSSYINSHTTNEFGKIINVVNEGGSTPNYNYQSYNRRKDSIYNEQGVYTNSRPKLYHTFSLRGNFYHFSLINFGNDSYSVEDKLLREHIYNQNINKDLVLAKQNIDDFLKVIENYSYLDEKVTTERILTDYKQNNYASAISNQHDYDYKKNNLRNAISDANENLERIAGAKQKEELVFDGGFILGEFIFFFMLTIIYFVFKNVHWKQLLLSWATVGVISAVSGIIEGVAGANGGVFGTCTAIFIIGFLINTFRVQSLKSFNVFINQSVIILNYITPFLFSIILLYLDEFFGFWQSGIFDSYYGPKLDDLGNVMYNNLGEVIMGYNDEYYELKSLIQATCFIGGFVFYLIFWNQYLKSLYLKLWALPKNK